MQVDDRRCRAAAGLTGGREGPAGGAGGARFVHVGSFGEPPGQPVWLSLLQRVEVAVAHMVSCAIYTWNGDDGAERWARRRESGCGGRCAVFPMSQTGPYAVAGLSAPARAAASATLAALSAVVWPIGSAVTRSRR